MYMYKVGMLCKHFKGKDLLEKNIYIIEKINVNGKDIKDENITYTGDNELLEATNLVIYSNIFQKDKIFAREYEDISSYLSEEKQQLYNQKIKVEPLTEAEVNVINDKQFMLKKKQLVEEKFKA